MTRFVVLAVVLGSITALAQSRGRSVVFVVDRSGSMSGQRIDETRAAVAEAVATLSNRDRAALITFNSEAQLIVPMTADHDLLREAAARVRPAGGTNFLTSLEMGLDQLSTESNRRLVVFITDGQAPERGLRALAERIRNHNVTLNTVAVGSDVNETLLRDLATATNGEFAAATASTIRRVLRQVVERMR